MKLEEPDKSDAYNTLLFRLETWTDELAARGPRSIPDVYREMMELLEFKQDQERKPYIEPCIDFEHQKGYK